MAFSSNTGDIHFHKSIAGFPNHSTPTGARNFPQTQLQFNLQSHNKHGIAPVHKPRPIIIEKLLPYPAKPIEPESSLIKERSYMPETMLSSEKLAFAVQLAKMDIKKLKNMLHTEETSATDVIPATKAVKKKTYNDPDKTKKAKKIVEKQKKPVDVEPPRHIIHLYPEPKEHKVPEKSVKVLTSNKTKPQTTTVSEPTSQKDNEMKRLRKDLVKYSQALDVVVQKLNQEKFVEILKNDDELKKERERNIVRAEEQRNRSARMLYMLQRKVEDLNNEIQSGKSNVKQTKKSQYTTKLASAHRAAVKALQTFVNHAPLYYNTTGKFPPMYKALAILIQQLTLLSTDSLLGAETETMETIEDLIESLSKTGEKKQFSTQGGAKRIQTHPKNVRDKQAGPKKQYLDQRIDWLKKKADELNIKSFQAEDATPERSSSLKHAIQALNEDESVLSKKELSPSPLPKPALKMKKFKSSVLLPSNLKKKRMKIPSRPYHPEPPGNKNYAAATVVSKIREKPPVERREKTPPTPRKHVAFSDEEPSTPKKRDKKIIDEARALISPTQLKKTVDIPPCEPNVDDEEGRLTPTKINFMEKEISRDKWLQQRKSNEITKLEAIEKMNTNWMNQLKNEIQHSNHLVKHAEEQIKERLKPLLDKAKEISQDEAKREEHYKSSLNKRLADVASQKAMSEGERLAEYILDDLITEAASDIQKIETDEHAELEAAFMFDRQNLETIAERLNAFEAEEEVIRRHWKKVQYSEIDSNNNSTALRKANHDHLNNSHTTARSVMFTAPMDKRPPPPVPDPYPEPERPHRSEICIPDAQLNTILLFKQRFENYLKKSIHNSWNVHPHDVVEELSDHLLDELVGNIADELGENCDKFVDDIYEKEFLNVT